MNQDSVLVEGKKYRLTLFCRRGGLYEFATFKVIRDNAKQILQSKIDKPFSIPGYGKEIMLSFFFFEPISPEAERWTLEFTVLNNPIPVLAIIAGVAILGGLALVFLTFDSIEEIIDSPAGAIAVPALSLALLVGVSLLAYRYFRQAKE